MRHIGAVKYGKRAYTIRLWEPGDAIPPTPAAGLDTETLLISGGDTPDLVLLQAAYPDQKLVHLVWWNHAREYLEQLLQEQPSVELFFHNAGFDMDVLGWEQFPLLEQHLLDGKVWDTGIRHLLRMLREGYGTPHYPSLKELAGFYHKVTLDKAGGERYTFTRNMKLTTDHALYAAMDAVSVIELVRTRLSEEYPTEKLQMKNLMVCNYIGRNGMYVDRIRFRELQQFFQEKVDTNRAVMGVFGYHPGVAGNKKALQEILNMIEVMCGVTFPRTDKTGDISTSNEKLVGIEVNHPFFKAYKEYIHVNKMMSTYLNDSLIGPDGRVHPFFNPLVQTGRTSCLKPNLQNLPQEEGLREQYIAAPGKVLVAVDYSQLELCTLAQANLYRFGFSDQGDRINRGFDIHSDLASLRYGVPYEEIREGYLAGDPEYIYKRATAKPGNFGFPGGMGIATVKKTAEKDGLSMTIEEAKAYKDSWLKYREMVKHMNPPVDDYWTEKNVKEYCRKHDIHLKKHTPGALENVLFSRAREKYEDGNIPKEVSRGIYKEVRELWRYFGVIPTGRVRSNCTYTSSLNTIFQGYASDGGKEALWMVMRDGWKIVNWVHDEIIVEMDDDEHLHDNVERVKDLMVKAMKKYVPDYRIEVEAVAMRVWTKKAKPVYVNGRLVPWEPEVEEDESEDLI